MAVILSAQKLSMAYGAKNLFEDITFAIEDGERIGLIGPNGAGKSTLLKILSGKVIPDSGQVSRASSLRFGFLEQIPLFQEGATVESTILEKALDQHDSKTVSKAHEIMSRLDLDGERLISELSGGWKKRAALARELLGQPDLLILDEPTNHLDIESILWLEKFLGSQRSALLLVTHDRYFLQRTTKRILELDRKNPQGLLSIPGGYAAYVETKSQLIESQERRETVLRNTLRRETEWIKRGAKARTTKQQARIQRHGDLEEEVGQLQKRNFSQSASLEFQNSERSPKKLVDAIKISKTYGDRNLFSDLSIRLAPGTRLGLLGKNGCGKSTLIRALLKEESVDSGTVQHADGLKIAYFEQSRDSLDPNETVANTLCPIGEWVDFNGKKLHVRGYLDRFLFPSYQMDSPVRSLSGGEQARLLLAKLMLTPAQLLVLDEPTNDLDSATLTVLQECLEEFNGAVILVTHDRYFLDQVATQILAFPHQVNQPLQFFSDLGQWETWLEDQSPSGSAKKLAQEKQQDKLTENPYSPVQSNSGPKKKMTYKEQIELKEIEGNVQKAEQRVHELNEQLNAQISDPKLAANSVRLQELTASLAQAQERVDFLYGRWEYLDSIR